jgi:hypothetical protein
LKKLISHGEPAVKLGHIGCPSPDASNWNAPVPLLVLD